MFKSSVFFLVPFGVALMAGTASMVYIQSGVNLFQEGSFITVLSTLQLLIISGLSYMIFLACDTRRQTLWKNSSVLWVIIALGFMYMAADEHAMIHEKVDQGIHHIFNWQETGLTDRIDDVLVGVYGLVGIGVLLFYRKELKPHKEALPFFFCGFTFFFAMVTIDAVTNREDVLLILFDHDLAYVLHGWLFLAEDSLKVLGEAFFILAFIVIFQQKKHRNQKIQNSSN